MAQNPPFHAEPETAEPECSGKLVFNTQKEAWAAATVARFTYGGARLKAYRCRHCNLWHLASNYEA